MYNRTPYNKTAYNRARSVNFEWSAMAIAEAAGGGTLLVIRLFTGSADAVSASSGVYVLTFLPSSTAAAVALSGGVYIRTRYFDGLAEAIAYASGTGVSTYGSVTLVVEGVNMVAGDELIIDTEHRR
jgi:hypothetical protein